MQQSVVIDDQAARVRPGGGPADGTPLYTTYSRPHSHSHRTCNGLWHLVTQAVLPPMSDATSAGSWSFSMIRR